MKTLQLKREYRCWYVIVVVETEAELLPPTGRAVGVDVGVVRFLTTSDGAMVANPGSSTRPRRHSPTCSGVRSAPSPAPGTASDCGGYSTKEWRKVRNRRRDFHHKTAPPSSTPTTRWRWKTCAWPT